MRERACWDVDWYELDPWLEVGLRSELCFDRPLAEEGAVPVRWVLKTGLWKPDETLVAECTVVAIRHPTLGAVTRADTIGLDYTFTLADGTELVVNAEEEPGRIESPTAGVWAGRKLDAWTFDVELERHTEMASDSVEARSRRAHAFRQRHGERLGR